MGGSGVQRAHRAAQGVATVILLALLPGCTAFGVPGPTPNPVPMPAPPVQTPGAQADPLPAGDEEAVADELRGIEIQRLQALLDVDMGTLEDLHAAHYELITPSGAEMDREAVLDSVESGSLNFEEFRPISQIEVRLHGDLALMSYKSNIRVIVDTVSEYEHHTLHTYIYERTDAGWQLAWEQATAVGGWPPE